jgi:glycosyltransferase involved in cell wall biosynthesis
MPTDLTVVIPTFRRPENLRQALKSVLRQKGVSIEVLVVDDCPACSAEPVVQRLHDPRVRHIRQPRSCGRPAVLRNIAWPQARGTLVHFLDEDDIVPEGHYARVKEAFTRRPRVGVVFGSMEGFGENEEQVLGETQRFADGTRRAALAVRQGGRLALASRLLFEAPTFVGGAAVVRKQCLVAVGGYNTYLDSMEDVELYARIIRRFGAYYLDSVALRYRIGASPARRQAQERNHQAVHESFRRAYGRLQFYLLKVAARTVLP